MSSIGIKSTKTIIDSAKKIATKKTYVKPKTFIKETSREILDTPRPDNRWGFDGANGPSVYDTLRASLYPQIYTDYNVGKGIVKGKVNELFNSLKHMNETFSKPGKEIRLAPIENNGVRGRNIVTMPLEAFQEVKEKGIKRIVDLRSEVNSTVNGRLSIKDGKKYIDTIEYVHVPVSYNNGQEDLETIKCLPKFFEAMNKGNVYIGCNLGSHRTDFAVALNYALNTQTKSASPILYLKPQDATSGVQRIYNKIMKMSPEDLKMLGLNEDFLSKLPKSKAELNERLVKLSNLSTKG